MFHNQARKQEFSITGPAILWAQKQASNRQPSDLKTQNLRLNCKDRIQRDNMPCYAQTHLRQSAL